VPAAPMLLSEILKLAVDSFRAAKTRFFLTALGMVIETASVILVVTIGMTARPTSSDLIQKFGTNSVEVEYAGGGATALERVRYTDYLTAKTKRPVVDQLPNVMYSSPVMDMHDPASASGRLVKEPWCWGRQPPVPLHPQPHRHAGRFFDDTDDITHQKCAVVSENRQGERYAAPTPPLDAPFEISGIPFTVIGGLQMSVTDFGQSEIADQTILIPYSVVRYFTEPNASTRFNFSMRSMSQVPDAQNDILRINQVAPPHQTPSTRPNPNRTVDIANKKRRPASHQVPAERHGHLVGALLAMSSSSVRVWAL